MNEKVKVELIRQLVNAAHFHFKCSGCGFHFISEHSEVDCCPNHLPACKNHKIEADPVGAAEHYRQMIDAAIVMGEQ